MTTGYGHEAPVDAVDLYQIRPENELNWEPAFGRLEAFTEARPTAGEENTGPGASRQREASGAI